MARNKIKIRRLESRREKCERYSKRKKGIMKKARDLAALCDVDLALVLVSPTNKPSLFHSPSRSLKDIMEKFCQISLEEREERRSYTMKIIEKQMKKDETELLPGSNEVPQTKDPNKEEKLDELGESIGEKEIILWDWENPETVFDLERLDIMEDQLSSSLKHIGRTLQEPEPNGDEDEA